MMKHNRVIDLPSIVPLSLQRHSFDDQARLGSPVIAEHLLQNNAGSIFVELLPRVRHDKLDHGAHGPKALDRAPLKIVVVSLVEVFAIGTEVHSPNVGDQQQLFVLRFFLNHGCVVLEVEATDEKPKVRPIIVPTTSVAVHVTPVPCVKFVDRIVTDDGQVWKEFVAKVAEPLTIAEAKVNNRPLARCLSGHPRGQKEKLNFRQFQRTELAKRVVISVLVHARARREARLVGRAVGSIGRPVSILSARMQVQHPIRLGQRAARRAQIQAGAVRFQL
mmetsp:Transcript_69249/g.225571  ORF Transcript_69249/g.225571 Transcript_69249/m.225571 type:complete len:276 (-) Transcript_69249:105-932(-)